MAKAAPWIALGRTWNNPLFLNTPAPRRLRFRISISQAKPEAAAAAPKALLASRTNTLFSIPMLFFMGSSAHYAHGGLSGNSTPLIVGLAIIGVLELNAIFGKQGPITSVSGVITSGFVLTAVLWAVVELL